MIKKIKSFVVYRNNMPRKYLKADTAVLSLPKKIVFVDKKNKKHLLPALTKGHHLATHYGHSAIDLITGKQKYAKLASKGNLTTVKRVRKAATKKVAEAHKATAEVKKAVIKANVAMDGVAKAKRKYTKKRVAAVQAVNVAAAVSAAPKKRGRKPRAVAIPTGISMVVTPPSVTKSTRGRKALSPEQKFANQLARELKKKSPDLQGVMLAVPQMDGAAAPKMIMAEPVKMRRPRAYAESSPKFIGPRRRPYGPLPYTGPLPEAGDPGFIGPLPRPYGPIRTQQIPQPGEAGFIGPLNRPLVFPNEMAFR
jgi:hypothetical protein